MSGILTGLRVVEAASFIAGPTAGLTLAQLGAEVIRIDPIGGAADYRRWPLSPTGTSLYWTGLNKQKRSVALDLSSAAGQELAIALATAPGADAGILLSNAPARRWLSYDVLRARRPDMIFLHLTGRPDGAAAVDYTVNARVGFPRVTGPPDAGGPVNHVLPAWDVATGLYAATGLLAAERYRARTGRGQHLRIALSDVALAVAGNLGYLAEAVLGGDRVPDGNFVYGAFGCDFETADGRRVMVAVVTPRQWQALLSVTGAAEAVRALGSRLGSDLGREDQRFRWRRELVAVLAPWFAARSADVARDEVCRAGALCEVFQTFGELVRGDPDFSSANPILSDVDQPGVGTVLAPRSPLRWADEPAQAVVPAPEVGADTADVLSDVLGLGLAELADLARVGVIPPALARAT